MLRGAGTETYCDSSGKKQTWLASGAEDVDNRDSASDCAVGEELNDDSCCVPEASGVETYCDDTGVARTRPSGTANDVDSRSATETYCDSNGKKQTRTVTGTCTDKDSLPGWCPSGKVKNSDGCCETCPQTAQPACTGEREGQTPSWSASACAWQWSDAADCPAGNKKDGWDSTNCAWKCKTSDSGGPQCLRPTAAEAAAGANLAGANASASDVGMQDGQVWGIATEDCVPGADYMNYIVNLGWPYNLCPTDGWVIAISEAAIGIANFRHLAAKNGMHYVAVPCGGD